MTVLQRPGGELATRPIHFFWVVDCSGSMYGEKIGIVNNTIQECIPEMRSAADNNPNAQLLIRALQFSSGASWITSSPVPVEDYGWEDMDANGLTELGKAFDLLAAQLSIPPMPERALPPVIVLLSDGQPTDDYKKSMEKLKKLPWFRKAVKIAISIGQDADDEVLIEFAGNKELVLQANNATALAKMIKWASTTASMVSAPSSKPMNSVAGILMENGMLERWYSEKDKKSQVFKLLVSISPKLGNNEIEFIRNHAFEDSENDKEFMKCFLHDITEESDEMFELRMLFYEHYPEYAANGRCFGKLCEGFFTGGY